ncbi:right-handed parallel beta-helix repeat-containing protein [Subtercola boreus]|uniref:Right handed beta helix domain-containing protein n=1 Tax=Subtercola boreus TaxID=120213 RepID=A0A3E0W8H1_9MICO|nr:right-handed parallel beta-helix repeat-containing protein [Subtercola boreus]RFA18754.1 hypothetical protein B7R24_13480 [Subtercola boreus]RFA18871.1 hypothetical protein B7R23_13470 [Subtercola boreus]RFA25406.1 hypothetical protein B7R25_13580 [Subtercola boreus]
MARHRGGETPGSNGHGTAGDGSAEPDQPAQYDRRLIIAGTVVASIAGARLSLLTDRDAAAAPVAPVPAVTVTAAASDPLAQPTTLAPSTSAEVIALSPYDFGFVDGAADATGPMQALLTAMMVNPGARSILPGGTINVTNLRIDYAEIAAQPSSGAPFGYAGPHIEGSSKRGTIIKQIDGTTGDVLTIQGKIGASAGPANNNKISGLSLSNLQIQGAASGGHGIYIRSVVDSTFDELTVTGALSGVYLAREAFLSGVYDEYSYNNRFTHLKLLTNRAWGIECSGTNAIAASFYDCEATGNASGGYKLAPSGMILVHCLAVGNGVQSADGRGLWSVTNTNNLSTNNGLTLVGCRFEGNSTDGGYEIEIESGYGHVITAPQFFATTGATPLGIGLRPVDDSKKVRNLIVTGGYFGGDGSTRQQRLAKLGDSAMNTLFDNLGIDPQQWAGGSRVNELIDDASALLSVTDPSRFRVDPNGYVALEAVSGELPAAPSADIANFGVVTDSNGKQSLVVRFASGDSQVIAREP